MHYKVYLSVLKVESFVCKVESKLENTREMLAEGYLASQKSKKASCNGLTL